MNLINVFGTAILFCNLLCIGIFIYQLKYVKQYGLLLWGVCLLSDLIFIILAKLTHIFLLPTFTEEACGFLMLNVSLIFNMVIMLWIYYNFKPIRIEFLVGIFVLFFVVWLTEFSIKSLQGVGIVKLNAAFVASEVVIVGLVLFYLLDLYIKPNKNYKEIPFLWISWGWLINAAIAPVLSIPEIASKAEVWSKNGILILTGIIEISVVILYSIGFWKTKNWVLQNQIG